MQKILDQTLKYLPSLNESAFEGEITTDEMIATVNDVVLSNLPAMESLQANKQSQQLLVVLGLIGSSVERHVQQAAIKQSISTTACAEKYSVQRDGAVAGRGLARLHTSRRTPFIVYFQHVARLLNHPRRDSFITFVEFNGPAIELRHPATFQPWRTFPAVMPEGSFYTFTRQQAEVDFIRLLKKSFVLQTAANEFLSAVQDPAVDLASDRAIKATFNATILIYAIHAELVAFMQQDCFDTDFFLDCFRQYACAWSSTHPLKPPSGANDAASLQRDLMLFDELIPASNRFPGYRAHVRKTFSVLTPNLIQQLEQTMAQPSIETKIVNQIGFDPAQVSRKTAIDTLLQYPWLSAYCQLYLAQRRLSRIHYASVQKYLMRPKQIRDKERDRREDITVVSNRYGTTGMKPLGILKRIDEARASHCLAKFTSDRSVRTVFDKQSQEMGYRPLSSVQLRMLVAIKQHSRC